MMSRWLIRTLNLCSRAIGCSALPSPVRASIQPEVFAQVYTPHLGVVGEFRGRSVSEDSALANDIGPIHDLQCFPYVVIGDQHSQTPRLEPDDRSLQLADRDRIDPGERLVE